MRRIPQITPRRITRHPPAFFLPAFRLLTVGVSIFTPTVFAPDSIAHRTKSLTFADSIKPASFIFGSSKSFTNSFCASVVPTLGNQVFFFSVSFSMP